MFDSFLDEEAECPKCHAKVPEWQTKSLQSLGDFWEKGDFVQYRKLTRVPEKKRKKKDGGNPLPLFRRDQEYLSDAPVLFNGKIPVHISCKKCHAWLEGYANILDGRYTGIVDAEAGVREKPPVLVKRETTAETLRADYERRLSQLQESCSHKKTKWMDVFWAPVHYYGRALVCLRCEKRLKVKQGWESVRVSTSRKAKELRSKINRRESGRKEASSTASSSDPKLRKLVNIEVRRAKKSFFGIERGSGPFTRDDEMTDHD